MGGSALAADVRAERLSSARSLLDEANRTWSGRIRGAVAEERVFPVAAPLRPLFPGAGLRRGATVAVGPSAYLVRRYCPRT